MLQLLELEDIGKNFGGLTAVNRLRLTVTEGEIFGLVGPNGSGKSTVLNMIGGTFFPTRGKITFKGEDITKIAQHKRCERGIARVFQRNIFFHTFTVLENIIAGFHLHSAMKYRDIYVRTRATRNREKDMRDEAYGILETVGLAEQADEPAIILPYGNQRLLAMAVALATKAKLLLLDEPLTGMNAQEIAAMIALIRVLREKKEATILLVEHNMKAVSDLCDRIAVLNFGEKLTEGDPKEVVLDPQVIEAYLGKEEDAA